MRQKPRQIEAMRVKRLVQNLGAIGYERYKSPGWLSFLVNWLIVRPIDIAFGNREIACYVARVKFEELNNRRSNQSATETYWVYIYRRRGGGYRFQISAWLSSGADLSAIVKGASKRRVLITGDPDKAFIHAYLPLMDVLLIGESAAYPLSAKALQTNWLAYSDPAAWHLRSALVFARRGATLAHPDSYSLGKKGGKLDR